jgi:hypothetical protein
VGFRFHVRLDMVRIRLRCVHRGRLLSRGRGLAGVNHDDLTVSDGRVGTRHLDTENRS